MTFSTRRGAGLLTAAALCTSLLTCAPQADAHRGQPHAALVAKQPKGSFTRTATVPAYLNVGKDQTAVAEISTITPDGRTVIYTDAGGKRIGFVDVTNARSPRPMGAVEMGGEPTSVFATGKYVPVPTPTRTV